MFDQTFLVSSFLVHCQHVCFCTRKPGNGSPMAMNIVLALVLGVDVIRFSKY